MKKFLFIGVDFSKTKFDVSVLEDIDQKNYKQAVFENTKQGYKDFLKWLPKQSKIKRESWLFCGEHTGFYSRGLTHFLVNKNLFVWLENPLQIKASSGIKRAKTDSMDACSIANYAYRYKDKAVVYKLADKEIDTLQLLISYRKRLLKNRVALEVAAKEMRSVIKPDATARFIYQNSTKEVKRIKKQISDIEQKMHKTIMESRLKENYLLVTSIKGIGMQTAVEMIIHTNNFTAFENARQLASYCGCAPFANQSGTIDKGNRISHLANKELKVLLTQCAVSAIQYNKELAAYFQRKVAKGKPKRLVINNVRNKLIQRICAIVKSKIPYQENYLNELELCA